MCLAALQVLQFSYFFSFFETNHYLPTPFINDKSDTFMDFFNPLYWSDFGMYSVWKSVYPPVNFLALGFFKELGCETYFVSAFEARYACAHSVQYFFLISFIASSVAYLMVAVKFFKMPIVDSFLLLLFVLMSSPSLFTIERGNLIVLCVPIIIALTCSSGVLKSFYSGLLINIKPYLIIPVVLTLNKDNFKYCLSSLICAGLIYFISGLMLNDNSMLMITNLLYFSSQNLFSGFEVLSMPSTFSAILYVFKNSALEFGVVDSSVISIIWCWIVMILVACLLINLNHLKSNGDRFVPLFIQGLFIIPTLIVSAGGYSILLLAGVLPYLYRYFPRTFLSVLLVFAPFDWIVLNEYHMGNQFSFLGDVIVQPSWQLTLGLFARLFLLVFANIVFCYEVYNKRLDCYDK